MKKQLMVLSALFIGFSSQCSLYDRMKAKATNLYGQAKSAATSAYGKISKVITPEMQKKAFEQAQQIAKTQILPKVLEVMKEPVGGVASQVSKAAEQQLKGIGVSQTMINQIKAPAKAQFEKVFGQIKGDDKDEYQQEYVNDLYAKQAAATTEEEREIYTKKLRNFFDSEDGKAYAERHIEE